MTTAGTLMRLSKPDFESLLKQPVIETVTMEQIQDLRQNSDQKIYILDVRTPTEFKVDKLKGSTNVPILHLVNRKNQVRNTEQRRDKRVPTRLL